MILIPSVKVMPAMTSGGSLAPFEIRRRFEALCINLKTIVKQAVRVPPPFVRLVLSRTVANVDSIGFVVRKWDQCSAGMRSQPNRGLVHFSAGKRILQTVGRPKTWTCPLPAAQGGQSHFRGN